MIMPLMTVARYNYKVFSWLERGERSVCGTISLVSLTREPATPRDAPRTERLSRQSENSKWLHSMALRRKQLANYLIKSVLASRFLLSLFRGHMMRQLRNFLSLLLHLIILLHLHLPRCDLFTGWMERNCISLKYSLCRRPGENSECIFIFGRSRLQVQLAIS